MLRLSLLLVIWGSVGCSTGPEPMMPTPVLYHEDGVDPFAHLSPEDRVNHLDLFYATGRTREQTPDVYGVGESLDHLDLGVVRAHFGAPALAWDKLHSVSRKAQRDQVVEICIDPPRPMARLSTSEPAEISRSVEAWLESVNRALAGAHDPDLLIYVHGSKVDFYRCSARSAELLHFAGRDLVGIVFDWPSHPNIFAYVWGDDHERARRSAPKLVELINLLATRTIARRIHLLSYSAGGIVLSQALVELHGRHPDWTWKEFQQRYRVGAAVFAAADVPLHEFLGELPAMHDVCERVTVTVSDGDKVLALAAQWIGGESRIGYSGDALPGDEIRIIEQLERVELLDVSYGKEERGFDIVGHHYWYKHPWTSTDVIVNLRLDLAPDARGLRRTDHRHVWHLPQDYPRRARERVMKILDGAWFGPRAEGM